MRRRYAAAQPLTQKFLHGFTRFRRAAQKHLGRAEAGQLVAHGLFGVSARDARGAERARGHVAEAHGPYAVFGVQAGEIVVLRFLQHRALRHGAGGHDADDIALHKPLGERRVFHLLADGDLVAARDEPCHIALGRVVRHAAHGRFVVRGLVLAAVARGEREIQLFGGQPRVLVEHLIKIAQTEKEDAVGILRLDLAVLLHHGRKFCHKSASFCRFGRIRPVRR